MLEFINVDAGRPGVTLLRNFSWRIAAGENWVVQGDNGGGKTLLLELLAGKIHHTSGEVRIDFIDGTTWDERHAQRKQHIHYVPTHAVQSLLKQDQHQYYQQRYYSIGDERQTTVRNLLGHPAEALTTLHLPAEFSIENLMDVEVNRLSNGQLKKLLLIKVLLTGVPRLMLFDYPFEGLDRASRLALCRFIDYLIADHGVQVVIVDQHNSLPTRINRLLRLDNFRMTAHQTYVPNNDDEQNAVSLRTQGVDDPLVRQRDERVEFSSMDLMRSLRNTRGNQSHSEQHAQSRNSYERDNVRPLKVDGENAEELPGPTDGHVNPDDVRSAGDTVVEVSDLKIQYGDHVILKDFNWCVKRGERWALVGRNGAGKTTLFSMIFADHPMAYSQRVSLFGRRRGTGESIWDIKRRISYLGPEQLSYLSPAHIHTTARDYLLRAAKHRDDKRFSDLVDAFAAVDFIRLPVRALSSGQLQVMLIIQCLMEDKELLLLDEPFQFLDAKRKHTLNNVLNHHLDPARTLILITHYEADLLQWTRLKKEL